MKNTKYIKPEGMKYKPKFDLAYELQMKDYHRFSLLTNSLEIYTLEEIQNLAMSYNIDIFECKKSMIPFTV